jgi:hypothetical protein
MVGPQEIIYSGQSSAFSAFTYYALYVYRPRTTRVRAMVASWRTDPHFPRQIHTKDFLNFALRHQRRATLYERQVAGDIWQRYVHWRRAQVKVAA